MAPSDKHGKVLFSNNLRVLRKKAGLTQGQLAEQLGRSRATINAWEDFEEPSMPSLQDLSRLAFLFKVSQLEVVNARFLPNGEIINPVLPMVREAERPYLRNNVEAIARRFEAEALEANASFEEVQVIRNTLFSPETALMFAGGDADTPMTPEEQIIEMEALVEKLRAWLKERIRRRTQAAKRKR